MNLEPHVHICYICQVLFEEVLKLLQPDTDSVGLQLLGETLMRIQSFRIRFGSWKEFSIAGALDAVGSSQHVLYFSHKPKHMRECLCRGL